MKLYQSFSEWAEQSEIALFQVSFPAIKRELEVFIAAACPTHTIKQRSVPGRAMGELPELCWHSQLNQRRSKFEGTSAILSVAVESIPCGRGVLVQERPASSLDGLINYGQRTINQQGINRV